MLPSVLLALSCSALVGVASASAVPHAPLQARPRDGRPAHPRAVPNSPSGGYAPQSVDCPSNRPTIRDALSLSSNETSWLELRRNATLQPMIEFLNRSGTDKFDPASYVKGHSANVSALPNIGIAVSGGGYRALMNGAGFLAAADSRVTNTTNEGGIGGLLQAATYVAGLSGGGWLVGSLFANNFTTVEKLRDGSEGSSVWQFDSSIFSGPEEPGISIVNTASYWIDVADQVAEKADAGFDTSITDYWGRALSYQLINDTDGGPAYTFSSIALADNFKDASIPFPFLVADGRAPNETVISLNATVFEFNPFEMGSFDPTVFGFAPTEYLGSNFSGGSIPSNGHCVRGFDQYGYVMGTSSSLFNSFLLNNISSVVDLPDFALNAITDILEDLGDDNNDIAQYTPNPFLGYHNDTNPGASSQQLTLVDGGEDLQNIPLAPLINPLRAVDVIFAVDSSADTTYNWPNGTALRATYERSLSSIANGTQFPAVPDDHTFINLGLNQRPTFFGCDVANFSSGGAVPPLIVYIPNAPYTAMSNVSTFTPSYPDEQRNNIIRNGYDAATQGNGTVDSDWPACVACAVISRSLNRTGTAVPDVCTDCFTKYCWNGTLDTASDTGAYEPTFIIGDGETSAQENAAAGFVSGRGGAQPWKVALGVAGVVGFAALL
ncbi:Lysophospholipase [Pleurostoma richardsiae]|uniref:Lysophospholipase n=1 Tax=Pleurostoma richardsiae TaxID=41990 RepID=A0AA38RWD1_9PEZI|nr:Lysophospholipase [Pleurostoma richardsiae]